MQKGIRGKLVVPACLAIVSLGGPACDDGNDGDESSAPATETGAAEPAACFEIPDMEACEAEERLSCRWDDAAECVLDCNGIEDEESCAMAGGICAWNGTACLPGGI